MPFMPMGNYNGNGVRCSVTPVSQHSGGGWYCLTCNTTFGERANPPCGTEALPDERYDKPGLLTVKNPRRSY